MDEQKRPYEPPRVLRLADRSTALGEGCSLPGSSASDDCGTGNTATMVCDPLGNSAVDLCSATGSSAAHGCQSGTGGFE